MSTYEARIKRVSDCVALQEPDRVPVVPVLQCYPVYHAGYTMKEVLYNFDKGAESFLKFANEYQPDYIFGHPYIHMGMGQILELMQPKTCTWAGAPGTPIGENSIHQFIEFPVLLDKEMDFFEKDYSGWLIEKGFPGISKLLESFGAFGISRMGPMYDLSMLASRFNNPDIRKTIETLWKIDDMKQALNVKYAELDNDLEGAGFPIWSKGFAAVPYDAYSDFYRGSIEAMVDLYENEDLVKAFCKTQLEYTLDAVRAQGQFLKGKWVFMALHKGMDGFMSDEHYRKFYWKDLQIIIEEIIKNGMTPYIYTEGPYDSRLECLKEVEKGKVVYHFEECDMINAKKVLGDIACIAGGFPVYLLDYGTKQEVIDECKRLIDGCAPGGGFIFETSCGIDNAKPENLEAMMETVKTYGKY